MKQCSSRSHSDRYFQTSSALCWSVSWWSAELARHHNIGDFVLSIVHVTRLHQATGETLLGSGYDTDGVSNVIPSHLFSTRTLRKETVMNRIRPKNESLENLRMFQINCFCFYH